MGQVRFFGGDLPRKMGTQPLKWCRSRTSFLTCPKHPHHLPQVLTYQSQHPHHPPQVLTLPIPNTRPTCLNHGNHLPQALTPETLFPNSGSAPLAGLALLSLPAQISDISPTPNALSQLVHHCTLHQVGADSPRVKAQKPCIALLAESAQ